MAKKQGQERKTHQEEALDKHPPEYRPDLNPDPLAGQNVGATSPIDRTMSAYDIKEAHTVLSDLSADDLRQLRILSGGERLEQDATYLDLDARERGPFKATGEMLAPPGRWFVPKKAVPYELWNRLVGVHEVKRTGTQG